MENNLRVKSTAFPNGSIIFYLNGMERPSCINLGELMKHAVKEHLQDKGKSNRKLLKLQA